MSDNQQAITEDQWRQAKLIWDYHQMNHELRPVDVAIGLGSHDLGVPAEAILLEPNAGNTGQNITLSREVLTGAGIHPSTVLLVSKPYMERRSFATARKLWPDVEILCASEPLEFDDYLKSIGDEKLVLDMLVGDLQRVIEYPKLGFATEQEVPEDVHAAYESLIADGFTSRLITS
ncbi:YdcF family protein [Streptomyces sp. ML-6]|uniref:YdcF family protein n=1 Tax=Streptomyces sp. ML-6 TaxID=2982693 RepID=UPI0024C0055D|nr:YdcF family protein [Streptomyces sp. ML-6]MDK0524035.1 YdcF family protein [Streptomyces sp. ML-6]